MKEIEIITGKRIGIRHLFGIWALDKETYPDCFTQFTIMPLFWLLKNPDIYYVVTDKSTGKVIAYALMMPLYESGYRKIVEQNVPDILLSPKHLSKGNPGEELYLYFGSVVISKNWHSGARLLALLGARFPELIKMYQAKGVRFKLSFADIVSKEGAHIVEHYGMSFFKETDHGTQIFQGPVSDNLL